MMASSGDQEHLFACTKCHKRHPFEALSKSDLLCPACVGASSGGTTVKCTYCRSEFQKVDKEKTYLCSRCVKNEAKYGKPKTCQYCRLPAAFEVPHCNRCLHYEKKHGPPVSCNQCRHKCAFARGQEHTQKVDGKTLCWLCTMAYRRGRKRLGNRDEPGEQVGKGGEGASRLADLRETKRPRTDSLLANGGATGRSFQGLDQMMEVTNLRDEVDKLKKQLGAKDSQLLDKDKEIAKLKATQMDMEKIQRQKVQRLQSEHESSLEMYQVRIRDLQRNLAKSGRRAGATSGTDSPLLLV